MGSNGKKNDIAGYIRDQEHVANAYVMRCFMMTTIVYTIAFILNVLGIFVIEQSIMAKAYIPALIIYLAVLIVTKLAPASSKWLKYFILFGVVMFFTVTGMYITYHVVLASFLPFLFATIYSSKKVMRYVYGLTVISTFIVVYGGYYYGLCDANMALLTSDRLQSYELAGQFTLTTINTNPGISLMMFFVLPRCLIYVAFMVVCNSIFDLVSGSVERARLTAELEEAKLEAEKANRAKSEFLAGMSHEIRTPVNAVLGMNEMIIRESKDKNITDYAHDVKRSSLTLLNIINEILDSSKIESGKMEIVPVNYEMGSFLNDLYNMISVKAKEKQLELIFDIDPSIPSEYYGDDKRIRQVLLNILSNAVKYTDKGSITLKLTGRVEGEEAVLHYSVKDTGIGIKTEDIGRMYEGFRRFDMERNRSVEGTGLGMKISQQFLKLMGSELHIQSEYGKGSEFYFDIVQKVVKEEKLGDFRARILHAETNNDYRSNYTAPGAKVLVVDDYRMNLKVFKGLLKNTMIQVFEAESGKECISMLKQHKFDMVFLDHMMPDMDGVETLKVIRTEHLCDGVPVIMLTANALVGNREKYIDIGFDDFISKPIMPEKLDKIILEHLPKQLVIYGEELKQNEEYKEQCEEENSSVNVTSVAELRERFPELDIEMGMRSCSGDEEFYLELFKDFCELKIKEELLKYSQQSDYKNYCIRIHGFKNTAYSIGAKSLGDLAYEMEKLSREGLPDELKELQRQLFEQYDRFTAVSR